MITAEYEKYKAKLNKSDDEDDMGITHETNPLASTPSLLNISKTLSDIQVPLRRKISAQTEMSVIPEEEQQDFSEEKCRKFLYEVIRHKALIEAYKHPWEK